MTKGKKKEIITPAIPDINVSLFKKNFAKYYTEFMEVLKEVEESTKNVHKELEKTFVKDEFIDVHSLSKDTLKACMSLCQSAMSLNYYLSGNRGDYEELLSLWAIEQRKKIKDLEK